MGKTTILIVEDEAIVAADLAGKLERLGYEVAGITARGEEAAALCDELRAQLVLMDISLQGPTDGIEAAEAIRRQQDVPVIYLTAHSDPATLARAKVTGPFGYILKPFEERNLATQIELAIVKHEADRQLRQERERLRVTLRSIGDAVIATDAEARVSFVNPVAETLTGWKAEEASGQPIESVFRVVNEQTGQPLEDPVARVLSEGRAVALANHAALLARDGRVVPIDDSAAPILDAEGRAIGAVLVFHDVTEKRRAEEALERRNAELQAIIEELTAAEEEIAAQNKEIVQQNDELVAAQASLAAERLRYAELFEAAPEGYLVTDHQAVILQANRAALAMLGRRSQSVVGTPLIAFVQPPQRPAFLRALVAVQQGTSEGPLEFRIGPISGESFDAELTAALAPAGDSPTAPQVRWMVRDITDHKRAEEQIQRHVEELAQANEELSRFNRAAVGRELRMIELKKEINSLCAAAGQPPRYRLDGEQDIREVPHDAG